MGNEISGRQTEVSTKYGIDLDQLRKWYHEHYINFLKKEISDKTWENKYESVMKDDNDKPINDAVKKFCKWKDIQKEIFEAVLDNHRFLLYTWEERAKKFIDEAQETHFNGKRCDYDDKKNQDDEISGSTTTTKGSNKSINLKGCLPKRRENLNIRLRNMKKYINDMKKQYANTNGSMMDTIIATTVIGSLALHTQNEIENLMKEKRSNMDNVCKLYRRTFADYKDISEGKDIVKHYISEEVRTLLSDISKNVGEGEMEKLWEKHFKKDVEEKLQKLESSKKGSNAEKLCTLDHSDETKPQCLRYMEEYLEEFLEQKILFEWFIGNTCKSKINRNVNCAAHCKNYENFLNARKRCYEKYKSQCKENLKTDKKYGDENVYYQDVKEIEKRIKVKSGCDKCGNDYNVKLDPLFDLQNFSTNKIYFCNCNGDDKKKSPPCSDKQNKPTMSLKGKWQQGIQNKQTQPIGVCQLDWVKHHSVAGRGEDPCAGVPSGSPWKCSMLDITEEGICLPPRRHEICISNIRNLGEGDISHMNSDKLVLELMLAAKQQAWRLRERHKKHKTGMLGDTTACNAIKSSFYDFGDIIKGTDKANDHNSVAVQDNLRKIFEKLRNEWKSSGNADNTKYNTTAAFDGLKQLRSDWWNENKENIWEAFECDGNISKVCGNGTPQDNSSQFLRWLEEWATEFCREKTWMQQSVNKACKSCGKEECESSWTSWFSFNWLRPIGDICDCKTKCREYSNWIHEQKSQFDKQKKYYDEKVTMFDFGETINGSHNSTTKINVSEYLKEKSQRNCAHIDFSKPEVIFSSYPDESHYRHKCSKCYAQLEADLTHKDGKETTVCGIDKILTKEDSNITHNCDGKSTKTNGSKEWSTKDISNKNIGINVDKVAVPPRYEDICKDTITGNSARENYMSSHEYYDNNRMLLSELILIAKHEGKLLWDLYVNKGEEKYKDAGKNKIKACTTMKRTFADIGDIVKGTNIVDKDNNQVEHHLKEMFDKLREQYYSFAADGSDYYIGNYSSGGKDDDGLLLFRKNWWETNRHIIWEAFNCDRLNNECANHNDIDKVPQLLRWLDEWAEDFYQQRQKKIDKLRNDCEECIMNSDKSQPNTTQKCYPEDKCKTCQEKCTQYKNWIGNWKQQWELFKKYYDEQNKDSTFKNYVSGKTISEYVVKKLKDIGYSNITSFDEYDAFANYPNSYKRICSCQPTETTSSDPTNHENNCDDNFKSQWNCDDRTRPTINTKMCIRENDSTASNSGSDGDMLFFNSFTQWLDETSYNMNENTNTLSQTCNKKIIGANKQINTSNEKCEECQKNCTCYKTWKHKIAEQWRKQKTYFKEEKTKKNSTMHNIDLNDFLHAYCLIKNEKRTENECLPKDKSKNIIDEKLEETNTRNTNVCDICLDEDKGKQGSTVHNCSDTNISSIKGLCNTKDYDNIENNGVYKKDWKVAKNGNITNDKVYVPPRRQQLCISYLKDNGDIKSDENLKKYLKASIMNETKQLITYYETINPVTGNSDKKSKDENNLPIGFCKAVERSFADLGNFVKGTNLDYPSGDIENLKTQLETFFRKNTNEKNSTRWWEQNKRELWKAVKCGINGGTSTGPQCPQNIDFDRRDQFLRWFEEWGEYVCKEHTKNLKELLDQCKHCDNALNCGANTGPISGGSRGGTNTCDSGKCTTACGKYKAWIKKRRDQWTKLSEKYNEKKSQYKDDDEDEATFWAKHMIPSIYLKFFNIDTCSKTFFKTLFNDKYEYGDQQKLCECDKSKHDINPADETDIPAPDNITLNPCNVHNQISTCHQKNFDGVVWTSRYIRPQKDGSPMFGVYAPPRRQKLCVGNIWQHATDKNTLLKELMLAAKKEGEFLKKYFESQQNGGKGSSDNYKEFCKALERSFYDLGDIVKGIDLRGGAIVTATEKKIHEIFKNELNGSNGSSATTVNDKQILDTRKIWWESNKSDVWKAMNCNNKCKFTVHSDTTPQLLRWYEEWYEDFCKHRNQHLDNINEKCKGKDPNENCVKGDKECEIACTEYSNWLTPKHFEWRAQKQNYQRKKLNEHMKGKEFQNSINGKNKLEDYLKDTYYNSSQCYNSKIDEMDKIVKKSDTDYKEKYEPLCSRCRMKKLIDKANEKKTKENKIPPAPDGGGGSGNKNPGSQPVVPQAPSGTQAHICQQVEQTLKSKNQSNGRIGQCKDKYDRSKKTPYPGWDCGEGPNTVVSGKGECMPPRRQKLCIYFIKELTGNKTTDDLRTALIKSAAAETFFAWNYFINHGRGKGSGGKKLLDSGTIPPEFLRSMFYTFSDLKDLVIGKDIASDVLTEKNNIKTILEKHGKKDGTQRLSWWKEIEEQVWNAIVCSLSYNEGTKRMDQINQAKLKNQNGFGTVKFGDPTSVTLSTFVERPQFLRWLTEWYDDYCQQKHTKLEAVKNTCKKVGDTNFQCDNAQCKTACGEYEKFMSERKKHWDKQSKYYTSQKNGTTSGYSEPDATKYLKKYISFTCGDKSSGATPPSGADQVVDNINALTSQPPPIYDVDEYCGCKKYIDDKEYGEISGKDNCKGLMDDVKDNKMKWQNTDDTEYSGFKKDGVSEKIYIPPRRQRICFKDLDGTSNKVNSKETLREQLLKISATEGYNLGQYYKAKNDNGSSDKYKYDVEACNAFKYSFLDLRDIILGTDNLEHGGQGTEQKIKEIFDKDGNNGGTPGSDERKQWWETNKKCVWEAMKCGYKKSGNGKDIDTCNQPSDTTYPLGDDRDSGKNLQFLRWFTEWAEDFCKHKEKEYNTLKNACVGCTITTGAGGIKTCDKGSSVCKRCEIACQNYKTFIRKWKEQFNKQSSKYTQDKNDSKYTNHPVAKNAENARNYLNETLKKTCPASGATSGVECNCMEQKSTIQISKQHGSSDMPASLDETPSEYENKCTCLVTPPPTPQAQQKEACTIVKGILSDKDGRQAVDQCNLKYDPIKTPKNKYPGWKCGDKHPNLVKDTNACMPPRRQKMCLYYLTQSISDTNSLRKAFIKTAAAETFLHWQYYKEYGGNTEAQNQLNSGKIPDEFLRSMIYTFGDYRDLCMDKDISVKSNTSNKKNDVGKAIDNIKKILKPNNGTDDRETWWKTNGPDIWEGMVCGLSHHIKDDISRDKLKNRNKYKDFTDHFAKKHQFLRWFAEWGEEYCIKRGKLEFEVKKNCEKRNDYAGCKTTNGASSCVNACEKYNEFIKEKKSEYETQKKKFEVDKTQKKEGYDGFSTKGAPEYLKDKCLDGTCSCMEKVKNTNDYWNTPNKTYETNNLGKKCECTPFPQPYPSPVQPPAVTEKISCVEKAAKSLKEERDINVNSNLKGNGTTLNGNCNEVDNVIIQGVNGAKIIDKEKLKTTFPSNAYSCEIVGTDRFDVGKPWRCDNINNRQNNLCLPPRRQYMCIKKIENIFSSNIENNEQLLNEVMKAAKDEAIDILKKLKQEKGTEFSDICDAMKYSFGDLADIIRGRDLWNKDNKQKGIQTRLRNIFRKIYYKLDDQDKNKYNSDMTFFYDLRSDWWDANRESIWKAMTCVVPYEAKFLKKDKNETTSLSQHKKCGHHHAAPFDDYIPQRFRWMQEWSEYFCKARTKEIEKLQTSCNECTIIGKSCKDDDENGTKCKTCKDTCKSYSSFVHQWKSQLETQSKTYNELYEKANINSVSGGSTKSTSNNTKTMAGRRSRRQRSRHTSRSVQDDDNKRIDNFLKEVKFQCGDNAKTAEKYLDKANNYVYCTFNSHQNTDEKYAFKDTPDGYENVCECEVPDALDECPYGINNNVYNDMCNSLTTTITCTKGPLNNDLDNWTSDNVKESTGNNKNIVVPPRRRQLCLRNLTSNLSHIKSKEHFKKELLKSVHTQGKLLGDKYNGQPEKALEAMKYSFSDYGDIIKGTDMVDNLGILDNKLNTIFKQNSTATGNTSENRKQWWDQNKKHIWHAMLCGYKKSNKLPIDIDTYTENEMCKLPNIEKKDQFLRWLEEWSQQFCKEKKKEADVVFQNKCLEKNKRGNAKQISVIPDMTCRNILQTYKYWYLKRYKQWEKLKEVYKSRHANSAVKSSEGIELKNANEYLKKQCKECNCDVNILDDIFKENNKDNQEKLLTELTKIATTDATDPINPLDAMNNLVQNISRIVKIAVKKVIPEPTKTVQEVLGKVVHTAFHAAAQAKDIVEKVQQQIQEQKEKNSQPTPAKPATPITPLTPPQKNEPDITNNILSSTVPVGISFALGSIALLFYLKKKPKSSPVDLLRVLDIPQNDYKIPDETSTNRYVPYSKYKGKTYIYVERDGDSEDDKYIFTSDTTDVTSSESEYDELDINDIYPYRSPKYKTLIEVVLKPTKSGDTSNSGDIPSDIPTNKFNDEEWNELKKDFISQYLQNDNMDVPNKNIIDDNMYMEPNIIPNSMEEKPFITQIQDRKLYSDDKDVFSYNIDWNIPNNISTNTATYNSLYTGIDLINDSLNSGNDIYDELLKRKENELFGTNHTKNTTTNSFAKKTNSDPVLNQLELFDKWLDRHRDMCNEWNNKEEMLHKLKDEWNKENNQHIMNISSPHNDMNDEETYNMINTENHEGNDITFVEHLGSTYNTSNDLQTNNLRTNIYMDIHYNENNDIPSNDNLENSYNSS
ncbi:erythrocyte membrane protein 1 (PfEMP1), truncated, putative [Plasmodium sp. gorilla clade G2]|uniref:erythrocyte membrane protein 1 (PfEMP1), truncated, putative n=1 Tax=Plasmodium sp. gorilla clade G2 TaxID=880535 RepID=UPI000D20620D|nr:erythrocyte membrane protein 1 (PfEMP1), truncated, putative [Plasmodium sp. gorilla clade G2]SOV12741.1 erythrocyte membrane protein 1 (PfEMP1), truncated, putative [Plasmodium sp. gorilla clade G2]